MSNELQSYCVDKKATGIDLNISFPGNISMDTLVGGDAIGIHAFLTSSRVTPENVV